MLDKLPPMQIGSRGELLEWNGEFEEGEPGHRHLSHLFGLFPGEQITRDRTPDLFRAATKSLELRMAAAGGHNMMMIGPPGAGKSMLAARLPGILPPLTPEEALETSLIHSLAGLIEEGRVSMLRPYRAPHHSASMAALTGRGLRVKPGEVSLAHLGVLFLDELPEFHGIMEQTHQI